jgi:hypothetical protein
MSLSQIAYLTTTSVPQWQALQASIDALGFDCKLDENFVPFESKGFLQCNLGGKLAGFEVYFEPSDKHLPEALQVLNVIQSREVAIVFCWGGRMSECASVLIVCAALAKDFDAVVYYADDELLYSADQLQAEAVSALEHVRKFER